MYHAPPVVLCVFAHIFLIRVSKQSGGKDCASLVVLDFGWLRGCSLFSLNSSSGGVLTGRSSRVPLQVQRRPWACAPSLVPSCQRPWLFWDEWPPPTALPARVLAASRGLSLAVSPAGPRIVPCPPAADPHCTGGEVPSPHDP